MDRRYSEGQTARPAPRPPSTIDPTGEFPFDLPTYLFHLFTVLGRHRDHRLDHELAPLGLNLPQHRALAVIGRVDACSMSRLAEMTAVDRTTMTRIVDHLVADDLVVRVTPPSDRRQVLLSMTPRGREVLSKALRIIYRVNRAILDGLDDVTRRGFIRLERAMIGNLVPDEDLRRRLLQMDPKDG
jgi:DNA-binding MarR family transcriptional regulator